MTFLRPSFRAVLVASILIRGVLILYSEWHDARSVVKYTDIDYRVFSDAARFALEKTNNPAKGPIAQLSPFGDPYTRETYRYTPLLALLLAPNEWLHHTFGKILFATCDILNGLIIQKLLVSVILPTVSQKRTNVASQSQQEKFKIENDVSAQATLLTATYLLNPLIFTISTRGSSESVLSFLVLSTLYCALLDRWDAAAALLGLSTHWKIYPVIYGVSCLGIIGGGTRVSQSGNGWVSVLWSLINPRAIRFTTISAGTFIALGAFCYAFWGYPFLHESLLYHLHRVDHRHNFSPYFYLSYLTYPPLVPAAALYPLPFWRGLLRSPLTSFGPQMTLALGTGLIFGRQKKDLVFAWFVQTVIFVLFNKVCTSQYFLWYLLLLPLLIPRVSMSSKRIAVCLGVWIGTQALWLSEAYRLEFLGKNVFYTLWLRSLIYLLGNIWVLGCIMKGYRW